MIKRQPPTRKFAIEFRDDKIRNCPFHIVLLQRRGNGPWKEVLRGSKRTFYKWISYVEYFGRFEPTDYCAKNVVDHAYKPYDGYVTQTKYPTWDDIPNFEFKREEDSPIKWQRIASYNWRSLDRAIKQAGTYWYNRCLLNKR